MNQTDNMLSINTVAARLGLSVHQLRRWELMFGLEIKRGRGQQRQYRAEDLTILERIKELVEQGWPTSQIRPQLEAEGLITPKLIGMPQQPGNPEMLMEAMIGLRSFTERRFIEISRQIDELRQLMISLTLKQELKGEIASPWQPLEDDYVPHQHMEPLPPQEISIGPAVAIGLPMDDYEVPVPPLVPPPAKREPEQAPPSFFAEPVEPASPAAPAAAFMPEENYGDEENEGNEEFAGELSEEESAPAMPEPAPAPAPTAPAAPAVPPAASLPQEPRGLGEVTDQNYLTVLGRALDMIGWSDEQADGYCQTTFGVSHWDELGRSQAERLIVHLQGLMAARSAG